MKTCEHCGQPYEKRRNEAPSQYAKRRFCSRPCADSMTHPKTTTHEVEHDCHLDGQPVRHTATIEATPTRLNDGRTRWSGVRCDGSAIEWVAE